MAMKNKVAKKKSIAKYILTLILLVALVPAFVMEIISYSNSKQELIKKNDRLKVTAVNVLQRQKSDLRQDVDEQLTSLSKRPELTDKVDLKDASKTLKNRKWQQQGNNYELDVC